MALTATLLDSKVLGWAAPLEGSSLSLVSNSITPSANSDLVYIISIISEGTAQFASSTPTSSGTGPTWTSIVKGTTPAIYLGNSAAWTAHVGGTAPGAITVTVGWVTGDIHGQTVYVMSIWQVTGADPTTPIGGYGLNVGAAPVGTNGNGPQTLTLNAAPVSADVVLAQCVTDEDQAVSNFATFDSATGTYSAVTDGSASGQQIAYNRGYRTGSTSTTIGWSDCNSGPSSYSTTQIAVIVKNSTTVPALVVDSGAHAHTADGNLTLVLPGTLPVNSGAHAHTADSLAFPTQAIAADASHGHTADPVAFNVALYTDDFNRADTTPATGALGANWNTDGGFQINGNKAVNVIGQEHWAHWTTAMPTSDHYVEADIVGGLPTNCFSVLHVRTPNSTATTHIGYAGFMNPSTTSPTLSIERNDGGGSYATLAVGGSHDGTGRLRLEAVGSSIRLYRNGTLVLSVVDTTYATGTYVGLNSYVDVTNTFGTSGYDNFAAGGFSPGVGVNAGTHGHTADDVTLTVGFLVSDGQHAHVADNVLLPGALTVDNATHAHTATTIPLARFLYPVAVSNRKLIDQTGGVYILNDFSSWAMAGMLTNAQITQALEGVAARHFSCVQIGMFIDTSSAGPGWHKFTNAAGQPFFATVAGGSTPGTPFRDPLGAAWSSMDWIVTECTRLGMTVMYSYFGGFTTANGLTGEMNACTVAEAYTYGQRVWNRYASNPNMIWSLEWENLSAWGPTSAEGQRADAFFHAIADGHAAAGRPGTPLIFAEQGPNDSNAGAFVGGWNWMIVRATSLYMYVPNSTEVVDNAYNQSGLTTYPLWDCEPAYIGATHYNPVGGYAPLTDQVSRQNWRERNYAILIRGGCGINFGDEGWWTFGAAGLYNVPWTWQQVPTNVTSYEAQYCWDLLINPQIVQDPTWVPDNSFLVSGLGSGDTKAAVGRGAYSAVAYFPNNSRTVVVDTTKVGGVAASYLTPSVSVSQTTDQSAFFPTDFTIVAKVRKPAFGVTQAIASQSALVNLDVAWRFGFNASGALVYDYSTTGTSLNGTFGTLPSSVWAGIPTGTPIYVAFSFDNNTTSYTYGGFWSLDGVTWNGPSGGGTVGSTPPAFFNSTSNIRIGAYTSSNADLFSQGIDWVEVRSGLTPTAGSVIWRFDAADWVSGTSWTDARSHTWLVSTGSAITDVVPTSVRLRWYDPVLGTFTNIAVGEAPTTSRTVSFPSGVHSDNNTDWVLVVDDRADLLGVNNANHSHTADNAPITVPFGVNDSSHGHIATTITLSTGLVVADALHAHTADNVPVSTGLAINNAAHAHTADNIVGLGVSTVVADALHGHRADNVDVAQPGVVNSAFHAHVATHIILTVVAISKVRLGSVTPQSMKLGTAPVTRAYLGSNQVF